MTPGDCSFTIEYFTLQGELYARATRTVCGGNKVVNLTLRKAKRDTSWVAPPACTCAPMIEPVELSVC